MWNCVIPPTKVVVEQPKYWENMSATNVEKHALRTGENIDINRRESPFTVIGDSIRKLITGV